MRKFSNKKIAAVAVSAVALTGTGVAYAYWTTSGAGDGTAGTASSSVSEILIVGGADGQLSPGNTVNLSGTVSNPNNGSVSAGPVTAAITAIKTPAGVSLAGKCEATNYTLGGTTAPIGVLTADDNAEGGTDSEGWSGLTLKMEDGGNNQDLCKNAVVHLAYSAVAAD